VTLHEKLETLFQNLFDNDEFVLDDCMTAADVPEWDSVAHINLMFAIERAFGVEFQGNQLAEFANVGELKEYLAAQGR
jgi:acyl carrier protein